MHGHNNNEYKKSNIIMKYKKYNEIHDSLHEMQTRATRRAFCTASITKMILGNNLCDTPEANLLQRYDNYKMYRLRLICSHASSILN